MKQELQERLKRLEGVDDNHTFTQHSREINDDLTLVWEETETGYRINFWKIVTITEKEFNKLSEEVEK